MSDPRQALLRELILELAAIRREAFAPPVALPVLEPDEPAPLHVQESLVRYTAQWVHGFSKDSKHPVIEHGACYCDTLALAKLTAARFGKLSDCADWLGVLEQRRPSTVAHWQDTAHYVGNFAGEWESAD